MKFRKEKFIKKNSFFLYEKLLDFLECEVNRSNFKNLLFILSSENMKSVQYEGNQYIIEKKAEEPMLLIIDAVSENNGVMEYQSRFKIGLDDLLSLIQSKAEKSNWI